MIKSRERRRRNTVEGCKRLGTTLVLGSTLVWGARITRLGVGSLGTSKSLTVPPRALDIPTAITGERRRQRMVTTISSHLDITSIMVVGRVWHLLNKILTQERVFLPMTPTPHPAGSTRYVENGED